MDELEMNRDDIIRMARDAEIDLKNRSEELLFEAAYAAGVAAEREACAKLCDEQADVKEQQGTWLWEARRCAAAIRARGQE